MNCSGNLKNVRIMKNNSLFLKESQAGNKKKKKKKKKKKNPKSCHYYVLYCGF